MSIKIELCCCTQTLLNAIKNKKYKKRNIAQIYALALQSSEETGWPLINRAIMERWSVSGLESIKNMAWSGKCFEEQK